MNTWLTVLHKHEGRTGRFLSTHTDAEDKALINNEMEAFGDLKLLETRKGYVMSIKNVGSAAAAVKKHR